MSACLMWPTRPCCLTAAQPIRTVSVTSILPFLHPGKAALWLQHIYSLTPACALCRLQQAALLQQQLHSLMLPCAPSSMLGGSEGLDTTNACSWQGMPACEVGEWRKGLNSPWTFIDRLAMPCAACDQLSTDALQGHQP